MVRPPTPSNCTRSPSRWRNTFIRLAPSRSPDSSVAIRNIFRSAMARGRHHAGKPMHEQTGLVGGLDHGLRLGDDGVAGDDRDAGKSALSRALDGARPDRRQVEAQILAALRRLHQHATAGLGADAALLAQPRHARQQPVGALDVLDRHHMAVDHDRGLADVERAERGQHLPPPRDIGAGVVVRRGAA